MVDDGVVGGEGGEIGDAGDGRRAANVSIYREFFIPCSSYKNKSKKSSRVLASCLGAKTRRSLSTPWRGFWIHGTMV